MKYLYPDDNEIQIRLRYVIEFALKNLEQIKDFAAYWKEFDNKAEKFEDKIFAEAATVVYTAKRISGTFKEIHNDLDGLIEIINPLIRSEYNFRLILKNPWYANTIGQGSILLTAAGCPDVEWDNLISNSFKFKSYDFKERVIFRQFDKIWTKYLVSKNYSKEETRILLDYSVLKSGTFPGLMDTNDIYALTHTIIYLTDFGNTDEFKLSGDNHLKELVDLLILWSLLHEDYDLLGELLICSVILNDSFNDYSLLGWKTYTYVWDSLNFIPSPGFDEDIFTKLDEKTRRAYAFKELYHPNFVAGILSALLLIENHSDSGRKKQYAGKKKTDPDKDLIHQSIISSDKFLKMHRSPEIQTGEFRFCKSVKTETLLKSVIELSGEIRNFQWLKVLPECGLNKKSEMKIAFESLIMLCIKNHDLNKLLVTLFQYYDNSGTDGAMYLYGLKYLIFNQKADGSFYNSDASEISNIEFTFTANSLLKSVL